MIPRNKGQKKMNDSFQQNDIVKVWDDVASGYDIKRYWENKVHQSWFETLSSIIGDANGKSLLEVGCGSGFQSLRLAEEGGEISILDLSPRAIEVAKAAFKENKKRIVNCYNCDALKSNIPDNGFDIVWNMGVIEHFTDEGKSKLLQEMYRMTKANGKTIIMVPNRFCWTFQLGQWYRKVKGTWPYGNEDDMSPFRLRRLAKKSGMNKYHSFAFDPISGWYWLPFIGERLRQLMRKTTVESHMKKSIFGWMTVLVIDKPA